MYLDHLSLHDFRSYREVEIDLSPGVIAFVGQNGQGKTNLIEAVDYLARLGSHRVSTDAALVRRGAEQALVRLGVVRDDRRATVEVEINPGRANRARVNRSPLPRARDLLGWVRVVLFAPDDLVLVKGDPSDRRAFTDDLLVQAAPRYAGIKADYDRVLKQRNSLLKTAGSARRGGSSAESALSTLAVWDARLAELGAEILLRRTALIDQLRPHLAETYAAVALGSLQENAGLSYKPCFDVDLPTREPTGDLDVAPTAEQSQAVAEQILAELEARRRDELDRGLTLVGPHRDEVLFTLGEFPVKGYASHGETWSFALALRLASFELLRSNGDDPILILDDVFAELDVRRRDRLAELVGSAEQVLVTAAVPADVPAGLGGVRFLVADSVVTADA